MTSYWSPLPAATRDSIVDLFCFIEDLPLHAFRTAVPWTWETWPQYRAAAEASPVALNVGAFVGHQSLRTDVMGADAWERPATDAERRKLAAVLDEALSAGALGLSTTFMDTDRDNRDVPSRLADDAEFAALLDVVARHPGATFQFVPRFMQPEHFGPDIERLALTNDEILTAVALAADAPVILETPPEGIEDDVRLLKSL